MVALVMKEVSIFKATLGENENQKINSDFYASIS